MLFHVMSDETLVETLGSLLAAENWEAVVDCADVFIGRRLDNIRAQQRENYDVACMLQRAAIQIAQAAAKEATAATARLIDGVHEDSADPMASALSRSEAEGILLQAVTANELAVARVVGANALVRLLDPLVLVGE